ncbi:fatty acyl-AMP ligase [Nocardia seriolae]|uniref:Long-chain-fatty-acid--CoA ligase n=1 Tax=Nocardia seriolae TaxID=37332 RepID=A0ABC9YYT3_9NOCA|nr:fatty acyl-AMP ligase [Nocardia seriolae]PSK30156.1 long-chain fatty acid--CoA ligase [Nocardia seriolae]QUN20674.1 fatty acyl-AMP ligase [Nocardia seriolae]RLP30185.1 long-chain fatty acid--CoA ligase [Nocardia seriolae]WKY53459.1 fatty acyl-AMP ligase [Nocardia seriolae]BAW09893.1 long-chain fatty acid--CoA ligase [Nocardia seriolae]
MSRFTDEMYATARVSRRGLVTGEPDAPVRHEWGEIHEVARAMAGGLAAAGIGPGDAVGVLAGMPVDIAPACQAVWMRGASITMLHQPTPRTDLAVWTHDTETVLDMIEARAVILGAPFEIAEPLLRERGIAVITIDAMRAGSPIDPVPTGEDDIALQQLTSGSTGSPKAVRITHGNFFVNAYAMFDRVKFQLDDDVMISWLPLFHDMGMVGFLSVPMQFGAEVVCVTPLDFLTRPILWAELISKYRGTVTAAPNFAYSLLARRLRNAEDGAVDLSSVRYMWNGAEPVDADTMDTLAEAGKRFGLNPMSLTPVYGMAETTLAVSIPDPGLGQILDIVDADLLEALGKAVPVRHPEHHHGGVRRLPTLGYLVDNLEGRVVDAEHQPLPVRSVGVIELRGPAVTSGYVTVDGFRPAQDRDGWLDTGDIGYFTDDGLVVVCGRIKDVIIMAGRNIYPTDIERAALRVKGVRPGNAVAVRLDAGQKRESFAVVVESNDHQNPDEVHRIEHDIVHAVFSEVGVRPRSVTVLGPGALPKTSSGKLRRSATATQLP